MWPKAIAQLIELLPHVSRLLPLADRYFSARTADTEASRTAMEQMAAGLRGDLGQVTASHAGLYRQLNEQSEKLGVLATDMRALRDAVATQQVRTLALQRTLQRTLLVGGCSLVLLVAVIIVLVLRH